MVNPGPCLRQSAPLILLFLFSQIVGFPASCMEFEAAARIGQFAKNTHSIETASTLSPTIDLAADASRSRLSSSAIDGITDSDQPLPPLNSLASDGDNPALTKPPGGFLSKDPVKQPDQYSQLAAKFQRLTKNVHTGPHLDFLNKYSELTQPEERLSLVQHAIENLLKSETIPLDSGKEWLAIFDFISKNGQDMKTQLKINTALSFGYRNLISKLSSPPAITSESDYKSLLDSVLTQVAERRRFYYWSSFHSLVKESETVDWSREMLLPFLGLGKSANLNSFKEMIENSAATVAYLEKARRRPPSFILAGKLFGSWRRKLDQISEAKFLRRLGKVAQQGNRETDSQIKTASIILLWHLKDRRRRSTQQTPIFQRF
ncbi:hypothetical protein PTTG_12232 [Puccinia triticina 1-1 BBBD Race 1]|uniref:Uncharacterized protein n=1 Tax=Puccinia triticina (isolate 1-1 / race 1 (BBBD)) TaxID=630390 RepID=A0A180GTI2_PUCT1|nr:hypothetical protein PTTG_12232 [Puccinia triticina 1-1 BBBD Race 1]